MPTFLISQTFLPPRRRDCHATISSPHHQKLLSWRKCGGVVELRSFGSARPCADSVRPLSCILARRACSVGFASCETLGKHYHASLRLRSLGSVRPCTDSVRPLSCILARRACSVGFASLPRQPFGLPHRVATKCG